MRRHLVRLWVATSCLLVYAASAWYASRALPTKPLYTLAPSEFHLKFSPCERWLLTFQNNTQESDSSFLRIRDAATGQIKLTFAEPENGRWAECPWFSKDGDWLVVPDDRGISSIWNLVTGKRMWTIPEPLPPLNYKPRLETDYAAMGPHPIHIDPRSGWYYEHRFHDEPIDAIELRKLDSSDVCRVPTHGYPLAIRPYFCQDGTLLVVSQELPAVFSLPESLFWFLATHDIFFEGSCPSIGLFTYDISKRTYVGSYLRAPTCLGGGGETATRGEFSANGRWFVMEKCDWPGEIYEVPFRAPVEQVLTLPLLPTGFFGVILLAGCRWWRRGQLQTNSTAPTAQSFTVLT